MNSYYHKTLRVAGFVADHFLFAVAMVLLIPPVPSMEGQTYNFWKIIIPMTVVLGGSRFIAIRQGNETWLGWAFKTIIFVCVGFIMYARVQYPPI